MSGFPPQKQEKQPDLQHEMGPHPAVTDDFKAAGKLKVESYLSLVVILVLVDLLMVLQ